MVGKLLPVTLLLCLLSANRAYAQTGNLLENSEYSLQLPVSKVPLKTSSDLISGLMLELQGLKTDEKVIKVSISYRLPNGEITKPIRLEFKLKRAEERTFIEVDDEFWPPRRFGETSGKFTLIVNVAIQKATGAIERVNAETTFVIDNSAPAVQQTGISTFSISDNEPFGQSALSINGVTWTGELENLSASACQVDLGGKTFACNLTDFNLDSYSHAFLIARDQAGNLAQFKLKGDDTHRQILRERSERKLAQYMTLSRTGGPAEQQNLVGCTNKFKFLLFRHEDDPVSASQRYGEIMQAWNTTVATINSGLTSNGLPPLNFDPITQTDKVTFSLPGNWDADLITRRGLVLDDERNKVYSPIRGFNIDPMSPGDADHIAASVGKQPDEILIIVVDTLVKRFLFDWEQDDFLAATFFDRGIILMSTEVLGDDLGLYNALLQGLTMAHEVGHAHGSAHSILFGDLMYSDLYDTSTEMHKDQAKAIYLHAGCVDGMTAAPLGLWGLSGGSADAHICGDRFVSVGEECEHTTSGWFPESEAATHEMTEPEFVEIAACPAGGCPMCQRPAGPRSYGFYAPVPYWDAGQSRMVALTWEAAIAEWVQNAHLISRCGRPTDPIGGLHPPCKRSSFAVGRGNNCGPSECPETSFRLNGNPIYLPAPAEGGFTVYEITADGEILNTAGLINSCDGVGGPPPPPGPNGIYGGGTPGGSYTDDDDEGDDDDDESCEEDSDCASACGADAPPGACGACQDGLCVCILDCGPPERQENKGVTEFDFY